MEYKVPKFKVLKDFTYFHHGHDRVDYKAGDVIDTDDEEMAEVAISQKWAVTEESEDQPEPAKRGRKPKSKE
jgi:hypothetical protein